MENHNIIKLQNEMAKHDQVDCPLVHHFAEGVYVRELHIPADTWIMGKRHRHETINILLKGSLSLYMGPGIPAKKIESPMVFNSKPGVKKFAYIHEDTVFLNIHPTKERDLEKIEQEFIISEEEWIQLENRGDIKCLG